MTTERSLVCENCSAAWVPSPPACPTCGHPASFSGEPDGDLLRDLNYLYWRAYRDGHEDTVESRYTDVLPVDRHSYHAGAVKDCVFNSGDMEVVRLSLTKVEK